MTTPQKILSDITVFAKYSRYLPEEGRRETWEELVKRNQGMHWEKWGYDPVILGCLNDAYSYVYDKKVLPSMRSLQFAGFPIFRNESRVYNCAYLPAEHPDVFSELIFLLLGGTGVGYSVQHHHVQKLPVVQGPSDERKFLVQDSIEGWADAVKVLVEAYFYMKDMPRFDFSDIRPKGTPLKVTGGKAPGPEPLEQALSAIAKIMANAVSRKLTPLEVHDICCHIADSVLVAGIRRAALISLFSPEDEDMMTCKSGEWWVDNPQRARSNNSVVLLRGEDEDLFPEVWKAVKESGAGEPGIYWTDNRDWGSNPCCEIALRPYTFC